MYKRIAGNLAVYTILGFLPLSFVFFFTPIYTRYLSSEQYGVLNIFMIATGVLQNFVGLGVIQVISVLYWENEKDPEKLKNFMASWLGTVFVFSTIVIALELSFHWLIFPTFVKADNSFPLFPHRIVTIIYSFFIGVNSLLLYYYRNQHKIWHYAFLSVGNLVLTAIVSIWCVVVLKLQAEGALYGRLAGASIITFYFLISVIRENGIRFNWKEAKYMFKIGFPILVGLVIGAYSYSIDRIMIEKMSTLSMLGIYGFAVLAASTIEILMGALSNSISPSIFRMLTDSLEDNKQALKTQIELMSILIVVAIVCLIAFAPIAIHLLISKEYFGAIEYIPLLTAGFLFRAPSMIYAYVFVLTKKTYLFTMLTIIFTVVVLMLCYFLYQWLGVMGIVQAMLLSRIIDLILCRILANRLINLDFAFQRTRWIYLVAILAILVSFYLGLSIGGYWVNFIPLFFTGVASMVFYRQSILAVIYNQNFFKMKRQR